MNDSFNRLISIVNKLRSKNGCLWDREQTLESIRENIIEEAYETVEAINKNDHQLIKKETGDLLLQAVFISQIASEKKKFDIRDVINEVIDKLIRRHPHVFKNVKVKSTDQILHNWENIKKNEEQKNNRDSILKDIPDNLPALLKANKVQSKVERFGFRWKSVKSPVKKLKEELKEFIDIVSDGSSKEKIEEEFGDVLFTLVNIGRFYKISPELALNKAIRKFKKRFNFIEKKVKKENIDLAKSNIQDLEKLWKKAKKNQKKQ